MSNFSSDAKRQNGDPARPDSGLASWRDQKVADPFDDPKVRQRVAELIIRAVAKPERFGA
jgi:hypothetical protein